MSHNADKKKQMIKDLKARLAGLGYGPYTVEFSGKKEASMSVEELRRLYRKKKGSSGSGASVSASLPRSSAADTVVRRRVPTASVPSSASPGAANPAAPIVHRRVPTASASSDPERAADAADIVQLEEALEGEVVTVAAAGRHFLHCRAVADIAGAENLAARFRTLLECPDSALNRLVAAECGGRSFGLEEMVFMDIETTGLAASPLFLIGIMVWSKGDFEVRQFLARDYAEERAVIASFCAAAASRPLLVTFNGKSFDFPYIRTRAAATGVPFGLSPAHVDLLHVGRRFWRRSLPNCKLQTLERHICGRIRHGDIPGSEIPDAYHRYVRSGNAHQIVAILEHNRLDLVTLADIMTHFPDGY